MQEVVLNDKSSEPNDELISSILGDAELLWRQTFTYFYDNNKDILVKWKFTCGKEWYCQVCKKKKTLCWIRISKKNSFGIGFPFSKKLEPIILQSKLPETIKNDFMKATCYGSTKYIGIEVEDSSDFENVKKLVDLKTIN